jgi:hypothetical protein
MSLDAIAERWAENRSLSEIGEALNTTRGVVVGAIWRARRAGDPRFIAPRAPKPAPPVVQQPLDRRALVVATPRAPVTFERLKPGMCRFPVNDPPPHGQFLFCSAPALNGRYCPDHEARTRVTLRASRG